MPICICSSCRRYHTVKVNGVEQPGQNVTYAIRRKHELDAAGSGEIGTGTGDTTHGVPVYDERSVEQELARSSSILVKLCCTLVVWLYLRAGVSRKTANIVLRSLRLILVTVFALISMTLRDTTATALAVNPPNIPTDIRAALKLYHIEPEIMRTMCCPKCFWVYGNDAPDNCTWRESPRSRRCNESLWTTRQTGDGPKRVPRRLYSTQSLDDWLQFFLGRRVIEDALIASFERFQRHSHGGEMSDIHESPAWRSLHGALSNPYNLVFGIYVDWFNPLTNRIAGKKVSYGVIVLYCMNLPPHLRFKSENVYIAGITPGPNAPNMITVSHVLELVMRAVLRYAPPNGRRVATFYHAMGTMVRLLVAPLIADIEAVHKVAGFKSHSAALFCTFCDLLSSRMEELNPSTWNNRTGAQVRAQAEQWRSFTTKTAREAHAKSTGVRWTPLYLSNTWDPVAHVTLGYMHNWLEGVLKHQLRVLWGIGPAKENAADIPSADNSEIDSDVSAGSAHSSRSQSRADTSTPHPASNATPSGDITPRASQFSLPPDFDDDNGNLDNDNDDDNVEIVLDSGPPPVSTYPRFKFADAELGRIRKAIALVSLPTDIDRPPSNLGDSDHGKLKADTYLVLFTFIFPLIIPEIWWPFPTPSYERDLLESFYHLFVSTTVMISYKTSEHSRSLLSYHYVSYRRSIQELYPVKSKPNHHYAMHAPSIMEYWGPLASLSEFAGERMNGQLQRTKTNRHMYDMDFTMLDKACRRARLQALLQDRMVDEEPVSDLAAILEPDSIVSPVDVDGTVLSSAQLAIFLASARKLDDIMYATLLIHVQNSVCPVQSFKALPPQPGIPILPPHAKQLRTLVIEGRAYSDQRHHEGNSAVQFLDIRTNSHRTGFIQSIWLIPIERKLRAIIIARPHLPLPPHETALAPYDHFKLMKTQIFDAAPSPEMITLEPKHVIAHVTTLPRPGGTYGIPRETLVVCWAMNRDRNS